MNILPYYEAMGEGNCAKINAKDSHYWTSWGGHPWKQYT